MDALIQFGILVCLLIVIILLAIDKVKIVKFEKKEELKPFEAQLPDIMGKVNKEIGKQRLQGEKIEDEEFSSSQGYKNVVSKKDSVQVPFPTQKMELNDEVEDDDWSESEFPPHDDRFSQGVSLEELMNVGTLLQHSDLEAQQQNEVIDVMQKIQGTELYSYLENSITASSQKVALLLDKTLESDSYSAFNPKNGNSDDFNINDFI
ncbi:hypothetical protein DRF65_11470 [Chryseobacterium pennae]|uniref:Conjugal transfer protein TraD n=1 Tax=Chryseobacterium pennae TaxID=2258962 RepID=A0A3D9C8X9_9FLAO|nr:hypothetical protein [Chryseobacterium pennae]REC62323.1 hypothetical protein DRF65_11470 [Chryseobacterium pennae]